MSVLPTHTTAFMPDLYYGEVHIWGGFLHASETEIEALAQPLSAGEWREAQSFHFEKNRRRYILRHGILRILLGAYANTHPGFLKFDRAEYGKPFLAGAKRNSKIEFNLSHSDDFFLIGVTRGARLGIDVERMQEIPEMCQIAEQYFSKNEHRVFQQLHQNQKKEAFYNCWTRKEAFIKATGRGLSQRLNNFDVSLKPDEPARLRRLLDDPQAPSHWTLLDVKPAPGFAAALAVEGPIQQIRIWLDKSARQKMAKSCFSKLNFNSPSFQTLNIRPTSAHRSITGII